MHNNEIINSVYQNKMTLLKKNKSVTQMSSFARCLSQDCPLVLVLRMFELCCDYRNFSEAKAKLLDFQRTLITVSPAHQQTNIKD